ncbi:MAG TPA: alcohol dehydrogenase catalytic domain-containing protein [Terriglobales bacterium]|nr:alcohol dehydrogenase catalytic domain-containing protein [Terriglobales bacterium]
MRALHWDGTVARVTDRPDPSPNADQAILRVHRAGICNTDLELVRGYMNFRGILGHELVGVVEHGPAEWIGRRAVAEINFACGRCPSCAAGLGRHCPRRQVMGILDADGAMAERVAVPIANLHAVPDSVDDDAAVFVEPLAAAFEILEQVQIEPKQSCVVLGDGKLGLLVAQVLAHAGAEVLGVGKHLDKLAILARRDIRTCLLDDWNRAPAPLVVEATGSSAGLTAAIASVRPRGTLILKSTVATPSAVDLSPLVIHEITVVGSRCGPFEPALRALAAGAIDVSSLIFERVTLRDAAHGLQLAAQTGVLKVLVDCA